MVERNYILLAIILSLLFCAPMFAKEFYSFPQAEEVEKRDILLIRRPANGIQDNNTGSRNITADKLVRTGQDATLANLSAAAITSGPVTATTGVNQPAIWGNYTNAAVHQPGVKGYSAGGVGVYGSAQTGNGVMGYATWNPGVFGQSTESQGGKFSSTHNYGVFGESYASGGGVFNQYGDPNLYSGNARDPVVSIRRSPAPYPVIGTRNYGLPMLEIDDNPQNTGGFNAGALIQGDIDGTRRVLLHPRARNNIDLYAYLFDTAEPIDNTMMRLLSVQNNGTEKFAVSAQGGVTATMGNYSGLTAKIITATQSVSAPTVSATTLNGSTVNTASINAGGTTVTIPSISATGLTASGTVSAATLSGITATVSGEVSAGSLVSPALTGSTSSAGTLTLRGTSNTTTGRVNLGMANTTYYDEPTDSFTARQVYGNISGATIKASNIPWVTSTVASHNTATASHSNHFVANTAPHTGANGHAMESVFRLYTGKQHPAASVTYYPLSPLTGTTVQTGIDELLGLTPSVCGADPSRPAVYDGAPGANAVFCNISGGTRSVIYDENGANPTAMSPFAVHLFEGAAEVTPLYWSWVTGGASNRIYGSGTDATFTPSVKPLFSAYSSNNYVQVFATYSSLYGRRTASCGTPINVTQLLRGIQGEQGIQGIQGEPGESPTITRDAVLSVFANDSTGSGAGGVAFRRRPNSGDGQTNDSVMHVIEDVAGYVRLKIFGNGKITQYKSNGTSKAFEVYSGCLTIY